jgi:hypothetical protein
MKTIIILENNPTQLRSDYDFIRGQRDVFYIVIAGPQPYEEFMKLNLPGEHIKCLRVEKFSLKALRRIISDIKSEHEILDVVTCEEIGVGYCGKLNNELGLSSENYDRFVNKALMKDIIHAELPSAIPRFEVFNISSYRSLGKSYLESLIKKLELPIFAKPISLAGSIGTRKIDDFDQLEDFATSFSSDKLPQFSDDQVNDYELDEFMSGQVFHCDSFLNTKGEILHIEVAQYSNPPAEFLAGKPNADIYLPHKHADYIELKQFCIMIHQALNLRRGGLTHLEVFKLPNGQLRFLEIAYRPGGAGIPDMFKAMYGLSITEAHIRLQTEQNYVLPEFHSTRPNLATVDYPAPQGIVERIRNLPELPKSVSIIKDINKQVVGNQATARQHSSQFGRRLIIKSDNYQDLLVAFNILVEFKPFSTQKMPANLSVFESIRQKVDDAAPAPKSDVNELGTELSTHCDKLGI